MGARGKKRVRANGADTLEACLVGARPNEDTRALGLNWL